MDRNFPFECPYQIDLIHCMAEDEEHWCVGILVKSGTKGDDSLDQTTRLRKWFTECGAEFKGTEYDCDNITCLSIEGTLQDRFPAGEYKSIETFGTI